MPGKADAIYENYRKDFDGIVQPKILTDEPLPADSGEEWSEKSRGNVHWGENGKTRIFVSSKGRVAERMSVHMGLGWLLAIFENKEDWMNYKKPMSSFHYHNC